MDIRDMPRKTDKRSCPIERVAFGPGASCMGRDCAWYDLERGACAVLLAEQSVATLLDRECAAIGVQLVRVVQALENHPSEAASRSDDHRENQFTGQAKGEKVL